MLEISICNLEQETLTNFLWACPATIDVWDEKVSPLRKWEVKTPIIQDLWAKIMTKIPIKSQELCALICRNIWLQINSFIFENVFNNPKHVVKLAKYQLESFQSASLSEEGGVHKQSTNLRVVAKS